MRTFFYKLSKNLTVIYMLCLLVLSYRLIYNEFYFEFHQGIEVSMPDVREIYPCGKITGIYTATNGIFVIDTCEIETPEGAFEKPSANKVKTGDYILEINGEPLSEKEDMIAFVKESNGEPLKFTILEDETIKYESITPILSKNGEYMTGIWIKDDLAGVGTITYVTEEGEFAALGHGMGNGQTEDLLEIKGGDIYKSEIVGIQKGQKGEPGEVKGVIKYGIDSHIGTISSNSGKGIYGKIDTEDIAQYQINGSCKIAGKQEIEIGTAQILSDISGEKKYYDIEITYIDYLAVNSNKGIYIQVTDKELLQLTGGIVQGMSGSPIIQKGKVVGAVTHVLVNDPTMGYGIFIENMLEAAE